MSNTAIMTPATGTSEADNLSGTYRPEILSGGQGNDAIDGSTDVITDFVHSANERDEVDLRVLGLASKPKDARDWIKANVAITEDGDVTVDLGGSLLVFESRGAEEANALFADVIDGLVLI